MTEKADGAFRTIGEVSAELGVPQHILRYWETRFTQLRPLQRAGNRRYYRPADVALLRRIDRLLNRAGYTVRGVQQVLEHDPGDAAIESARPSGDSRTMKLASIRDALVRALGDDSAIES
jgi:DNA-binding transcriptional MerR regulator